MPGCTNLVNENPSTPPWSAEVAQHRGRVPGTGLAGVSRGSQCPRHRPHGPCGVAQPPGHQVLPCSAGTAADRCPAVRQPASTVRPCGQCWEGTGQASPPRGPAFGSGSTELKGRGYTQAVANAGHRGASHFETRRAALRPWDPLCLGQRYPELPPQLPPLRGQAGRKNGQAPPRLPGSGKLELELREGGRGTSLLRHMYVHACYTHNTALGKTGPS